MTAEERMTSPPPFAAMADEQRLYLSRGHQEALARMRLVIEGQGLGVLTGEVGSGKSTLIRRLSSELDHLLYTNVYICLSGLRPKDFYAELLGHLGETAPYSLTGARRLWQERSESFLTEGAKQWVVWVDEGQEMTDAMLQELRFAQLRQVDARARFALILAGQPELRRTLRLKRHEAIAQRVTLSYHLTGLTREETGAYIRAQNGVGEERVLFADSAVAIIHSASQGLPRVVNHLCRQALYEIAGTQRQVVEEGDIQRILADQERQRGTAAG